MFICCYILSDKDKQQYSTQLSHCDCVEGDRTELLTQVESDKNFCRGRQPAIDYGYFVDTLKINTVIYIKNKSDNKILGACSIYLERLIIIYGICVPDNGIKGIGTLLLDKVKCIGKLIEVEGITITVKLSLVNFYKKNGFIEYDDTNSGEEDDYGDSEKMMYSFKQTAEAATTEAATKGGTRKLTPQKKSKKMNKKSKKRNKKSKKRNKKSKKKKN
jgi:hypothetical protein